LPVSLFASQENFVSEIPKWFERKFDLSFPVSLYPNVCARLRGTPARLEGLVRAYSPAVLTPRHADTWSAQENAGHLLDLEPLWLVRVEDYLRGVETLTVADLSNRRTHEGNHNARNVQELLADFRKVRTLLLERVETLDAAMFSRTALHPRLKTPMRLVDHLFFVAEHDDQHLARIWELGKMQ
jgi:DinB superfamily